MSHGPDIARIGALIGDPARAAMLTALMSGKALTASELARVAGIGAPTASAHLVKLTEGGLIAVEKQGRHRYVRLAGAEVAEALEALLGLAQSRGHLPFRPGPDDQAMRRARVCYDHLAGEMGIALYRALHAGGALALAPDGVALTDRGQDLLDELGLDMPALMRARRPTCRTCLDWSERTHHLAGGAGAALLTRFRELGWLRPRQTSRALRVTLEGERELPRLFARLGAGGQGPPGA